MQLWTYHSEISHDMQLIYILYEIKEYILLIYHYTTMYFIIHVIYKYIIYNIFKYINAVHPEFKPQHCQKFFKKRLLKVVA
jgi:hypothetical protein